MATTNLANAQTIILVELDGQVHLVAMEKEKLETCEFLIKSCISTVVPTKVTHKQLVDMLMKR